MVERSRTVSEQLSSGIDGLMRKNKLEVNYGVAKLDGPGMVSVAGLDKAAIKAKSIIATGTRVRILARQKAGSYLQRSYGAWSALQNLCCWLWRNWCWICIFLLCLESMLQLLRVRIEFFLQETGAGTSAVAQKSFEKQGLKFVTRQAF